MLLALLLIDKQKNYQLGLKMSWKFIFMVLFTRIYIIICTYTVSLHILGNVLPM